MSFRCSNTLSHSRKMLVCDVTHRISTTTTAILIPIPPPRQSTSSSLLSPQHLPKLHLIPPPTMPPSSRSISSPTSDDVSIDAHSSSALATTKRNLRYLYDPKTAPGVVQSRRTRTVLRVLRSGIIFVFWRLVRYAKYVAIGSLVATIG